MLPQVPILVKPRWHPSKLFLGAYTGAAIDFTLEGNVWQDSSATTPGALNNPIGLIKDVSGNGNNATSSGSARPQWKQDGRRFYAEGDGVDDVLNFAAKLIPSAPPFTIIFNARFAGSASGASVLLHQYASGQTGRLLFATNQNSNGATSSGRLNPFINGITNGAGFGNLPLEQNPGGGVDFTHSFISAAGSEASAHYLNGVEIDRFTVSSVYQGANTSLLGLTGLFNAVQRIYRLIIINRTLAGIDLTNAHAWVAG